MRQPKSVYNARYRAKHPDRVKASNDKWMNKNIERVRELRRQATARMRAKDPEKAKKMARENGQKNRAKRNEATRRWRKRNPEKVKLGYSVAKQKRRARKLGGGGTYTIKDVRELLVLQKHRCAYCRLKLANNYHVDHIIALARGGSNSRSNIQILCEPCNHKKHARDPIDFAREEFGMLL